MKLNLKWGALSLALLATTTAVADESVIGYVKTIADDTYIVENGYSVKATLGSPVRVGAVLKTSKNGSAGITLKDNTIISIGSDTEVKIDEYQFAPNQDKLKLAADVLKGTLHYISGVIAKLKPEAVTIKTPTGVIAVRGTRFLVKIDK